MSTQPEAFKAQLVSAKGMSCWVIAVFVDVRGFTAFAGKGESVEAALFIKRMYFGILDRYFPDATFVKPTGDGLMLIFEFEEGTLDDTIEAVFLNALELVEAFPSFINDPMLSGPLPQRLGVGIAQGPATRLSCEDGDIDFSGRALNLAARLMDIARPGGVVVDGRVGDHTRVLLEDRGFEAEPVYLRGIAETESPRLVFRHAQRTSIPHSARKAPVRYTPIPGISEGLSSGNPAP